MALDGAFLHHIKSELEDKLIGGRVDKVYQPSRDEIVLAIRTRSSGAYKVLLSARPDTARIHITKINLENPKQPPMLCMLLRKRLQGGRLVSIEQIELERAIRFNFDCVNELGDRVNLSLVCEIMGKYSNIILVNEEEKIVDALKRVDADMSSERLIFPGLLYREPPKQDKLCILNTETSEIIDRIKSNPKAMSLSKNLMGVLQGISPVVSRELEHIAGRGEEVTTLNFYSENRLITALDELRETIENSSGTPQTVIMEKPRDFSFMNIEQYQNSAVIREEESFSVLLERYYSERDQIERMRVKSADLLKLLANRSERLSRKINNQKAEIDGTDKKEESRIIADLINSNLYAIQKGQEKVKLINYYDENMAEIEISLDKALSPADNAQKYYKDYRKAKTAKVKLAEQIEIGDKELEYLDTVFFALTQANCEQDLIEIRNELSDYGYVKKQKANKNNKVQKETIAKTMELETSDGFKVLVGRNNKQNDKLSLKDANRNDLWFHTKDIPGSHVVLVLNGEEPSEIALYDTARIAARFSKAKNSTTVPVDYTKVRYLSKPQGSKAGKVIYINQKTLYVDP